MFNREQTVAFNILNTGRNVFLTGDAGVGKSYIIQKFIEHQESMGKEVLVCAPTGIAAINVNGVTIHRAFDVPLKPLVESPKSIPAILRNVSVIIIDEISMCRIDLFDYISKVILNLNIHRRKNKLSDVQLVVVGDFFQLPPVLKEKDKEILENYYGRTLYSAFAFKSDYWKIFNFVNIVLTESMRQNNREFKYYLNMARKGNKNCIKYFMSQSSKHKIQNAITVCGLNKTAREINISELDKLKEKPICYIADKNGVVTDSDKMVDDELVLKVGARVMSVVNDIKGEYQNGSLGTVLRLNDNSVVVQMDNGNTVRLEKYEWSIEDYILQEDEKGKRKLTKTTIGTYKQIPLKIAYAITIHKSQGQTYDAVNIDPYCWDYGQLYVALSRAKDIKNMHILNNIKSEWLKASLDVQTFYNQISKSTGGISWNK